MDKHYLTSLFAPQSIALFSKVTDPASPEQLSVRHWLSQQSSQAKWHEVDMNSVGSLSEWAHQQADMAVIDLSSKDVPDALEIAGRMKCRAAVITGSGYSAQQARTFHEQARHHGMALLGPNSAGFQVPRLQLNASRIGPLARKGPIGLISQSGALTASILDWAQSNHVGFSNVVSLGPNTSVDVAQVLDYMANDHHTHSIVVYLEGISNARRFMSSLRAAAYAKPVVVLKAGRQQAGNRAAQTHSGLACSPKPQSHL